MTNKQTVQIHSIQDDLRDDLNDALLLLAQIENYREQYTSQDHANALLKVGELTSKEAERSQKSLDALTKQAALTGTISARAWAEATNKPITTTAKRFREYRQDEADAKAQLRKQTPKAQRG